MAHNERGCNAAYVVRPSRIAATARSKSERYRSLRHSAKMNVHVEGCTPGSKRKRTRDIHGEGCSQGSAMSGAATALAAWSCTAEC